MRKTTLVIDDEKLEEASRLLGTSGIRATVDAALDEVLRRHTVRATVEDLATIDREALGAAWR